MFTGIIETTSKIQSVKTAGRGLRVQIEKPHGWKLRVGESVSVDGICSTVVAQSARMFDVHYMRETLSKTTALSFAPKRILNLERSMKYGQRIEGHFVLGHVDARVVVKKITRDGSSRLITFSIPRALRKYIAVHGSITANGVSLTVARLSGASCTIALIPHTLSHTNLGLVATGDRVNVEVDYLARYGIAALTQSGTVGRNAAKAIRKKAKRGRRLKA